MNYDGPAELIDGGWHFVTRNRRSGTHPIGACATHGPHGTEAEARECYGEYLRSRVRLNPGSCRWSSCQVRACDKPARNTADVEGDGYRLAVLCDEHLTVPHAIEVMHLGGPAGDSMHS